MKDGFVRVAAGTGAIRVADCMGNAEALVKMMQEAQEKQVKLLVLPEMCITGYTAGDLLLQTPLMQGVERALECIVRASGEMDMLVCVGAPVSEGSRLYNCAVFISRGQVLGVVPKRNLPNYGAYYELRHFTPGPEQARSLRILGKDVPFGAKLLFTCAEMPQLQVAAEICEEMCAPDSPGVMHAMAGATVIANPSASDESVGKADYRRQMLCAQSARLVAAYICAGAGEGESSTDLVFAGHDIIAENGVLLAQSQLYTTGLTIAEIDVDYLERERRRMNTFGADAQGYTRVEFHLNMQETPIERFIDPMPFVPSDPAQRAQRCEEILSIQAHGLATRMKHIHCRSAVLAVSGGLDSTLALLVIARAFDLCGLHHSGITTLTMPCFGTTSRTRSNAQIISERLGTDFKEIRIEAAVKQHFADIGQSMDKHDVTFENGQARERTQVLMDYANKTGALAIGTGDLSELALGWATYNGDHMSMYGVNASVPKTLVRYLVAYEADRTDDAELAAALRDILATPVSPELLPPVDGEIAQKTEDLVGPYELHDFFLYHMLRRGEQPEKIVRLALIAFGDTYDEAVVRGWLKVFMRRFFNQQFKRSCMPDGPRVGSVALSPRGDLRMPSDAVGTLWQPL